MNLRNTYILFGVAAAVLIAFAVFLFVGSVGSDKSQFVLPELHKKGHEVKAEAIDRLAIDNTSTGKVLAFAKTGEGWQIERPFKARADQRQVNNLVGDLVNAKKEQAELSSNPKEYDLDSPPIVVTLARGDEEWKLNIGKQTSSEANAQVYVADAARPKKPMAVKRSEIEGVFKTVNDFRDKDLLTAHALNTESIDLKTPKNEVALEKSSGRWRFQKPAFGLADAGGADTGVNDLLSKINQVRVETDADFVANDVSDTELADKYGLAKDSPATLRILVKYHKGGGLGGDQSKGPVTEALLIGKKFTDEKKEDKKDDKDKPVEAKAEYYYARLEGENHVVRVPAAKVEPILKIAEDPDPLRDRNLVSLNDFQVDAINVVNPAAIELRRDGMVWKLYRGGVGQPADRQAVDGLLKALSAKKLIKRFPNLKPEEAGLSEKDRLAEVSIWENGLDKTPKKEEKKDDKAKKKDDKRKDDKKDKDKEKKEEKKPEEPKLKDPKKPTVRLTFGKRDKDKGEVIVRREVAGEKEPTLAVVPDSVLDKVLAGPLAYFDRTLPSFAGQRDVEEKQVTIVRNGERYVIKKEKTGSGSPWSFEEPKELAGRKADEQTLGDLIAQVRWMQAGKVVAEKPSEKQLEEYGLSKKPQAELSIVVTKDKKDETYTFTFGKELADKGSVYLKTNKNDLVYVVNSSILATLQRELLDTLVLNFDSAKVKSIKLTGWKNVTGVPTTLAFERNDKREWVSKAAGFDLDPSKVQALVNETLAHLRANKFVSYKGGPAKGQGLDIKLDPKASPLTMEITLEGDKKPQTITLTIGGLDAKEKAYYATASTLPGAVFLVPEASFQKVLEKPAYFSKGT